MAVLKDVVNLQVNISGNDAQNRLNDLRKRADELAYTMKHELTRGTKDYIAAAKELDQVKAKMAGLKKEIGLAAFSQKELRAEMRKLQALKGNVIPFSKEFKKLEVRIGAVRNRLYEVNHGVQGLSSTWGRLGKQVKQFGAIAAGYLGFQFVISQIRKTITESGKLSDQLADVQRVTGLTAAEVDSLNESLRAINTRTSTEGLLNIAIIAGKLGVAKDDVLAFTKAVDLLVVSLGDELGSADQITTQLGKILNVFEGEITGESITKLGNAFVELANTGPATGAFIADFDKRLSGMAKSAGISLGALSGLGAGLEELGSRVESSSSAVQKLILRINEDLPKAAEIAGSTLKDFKALLAQDPTEALLRYSEGLVKNKAAFSDVVASLKDAGQTGVRVITTLTKMGESADYLRGRIDLGSKSIQENTAITEAFSLKNNTLGASIDKLGKEFTKMVTGTGINTFLKGAVDGIRAFIEVLKDIPGFLQRNRTALIALSTILLAYVAAKTKATQASILNRLVTLSEIVATKLEAAAKAVGTAATVAYGFAKEVLAGKIKIATVAQRVWNFVLRQNPIVWVVLAIGGLITAVSALTSRIGRLTSAQRVQNELQKKIADATAEEEVKARSMFKTMQEGNLSYDAKKKLLQELIEINPEYLKGLSLENVTTQDGIDILDNYIKKLHEVKKAKALNDLILEKEKRVKELDTENKGLAQAGDVKGNFLKDVGSALGIGKGSSGKQLMDNFQELKKLKEDLKLLYADSAKQITKDIEDAAGKDDGKIDSSVAGRRKHLEEEINKLKGDYEKLNATDAAGQKSNLDLQRKYQAELDALDHKSKKTATGRSSNAEQKRILKETQDFLKQIEDLKEEAANAGKSKDALELQAVEKKYNELLAKAQEFYKKHLIDRNQFGEAEKAIIERFNQEVKALNDKRFDTVSKVEYKTALDDTKNYFDEQKRLAGEYYVEKGKQAAKSYKEKRKEAGGNPGEQVALDKEYLESQKTNKQDYGKQLLTLDLKEKAQLLQVAKDYTKTVKGAAKDAADYQKDLDKATTDFKISEMEKRVEAEAAIQDAADKAREYRRKELQEMLDHLNDFTTQALSITQNFVNALDNIDQRNLDRDVAVNEAKKSNLQKQLNGKLISQKQYDKKVAKADEDLEKKRHEIAVKAFKRQQAMAITGALINGAMAVTSTLAARPGMTDIISLGTLRAIQVALVVATTAAQVAAIATQKPPKAARGNWFRKGDKHSDPSGGIPVLIERDEAVMKALAMTDDRRYTVSGTPAQITSGLNTMHGGESWSPGAVIKPDFMNRPRMNAAMPRIMEQGGVVRPLRQSANGGDDTLFRMLIEKQDELIRETKNKNESLHAVVSIREYREQEAQYEAARRAGGINQK